MYLQQQQLTIEELQKQVSLLKQQVDELMAWKTERETQQIVFPLDRASAQVISRELGL